MSGQSEQLVTGDADEFPTVADLWQWSALCRALHNPDTQGPEIQRVVVDSRQVREGDLFIALAGDPGPRFNPSYRSQVDGHDFINDAVNRGARGVMCSRAGRDAEGAIVQTPTLQVADTYNGMWLLGGAGRERLNGPVVAITGSSGKTTAKYIFRDALGAFSPPGSFNNHIGVPLALANTPAGAPCAVYEIGTNHPGEIEPLALLAKPDVAVVLNVHSAHIENFSGRHALFAEKTSIFNALDDKSNAISEDEMELSFGVSFGTSASADARVLEVDDSGAGASARIRLFNETLTARVPGGGLHRAKAVAAALLACKLLDVSLEPALALQQTGVPRGRGNRSLHGGVWVTDESYNANPDSMRATLEGFAARQVRGRKVVVVGEMLELGELGEQAHLSLAELLREFDRVLCVGEGSRGLAADLDTDWYADCGETLADVAAYLRPDDEVLVKGSNRVFWAHNYVQQLCSELEQH